MEQNRNKPPRWFEPDEWDGQDSSLPDPPWEPDEIDRLLHPEMFGEDEADDPPPAFPARAAAAPAKPAAPSARPAQGTGTGLYYKDGTEIPPTHPDHGPMHLIPRQEDGRISAYYYCSKAELEAAEISEPPPRRYRKDGFTPERQELFLEALRGGASGREAARRIGISPTTAYNLYNSPDGAAFRAAWDEAARVADIVLEDTAFDRAVNGQEEVVYHQGQRVGVRWKYDNKLLIRLLQARLPLKYAPLSEIEGWLKRRGIAPPADVDGALERLRAAEAEWGRRLPGEEALQIGAPGGQGADTPATASEARQSGAEPATAAEPGLLSRSAAPGDDEPAPPVQSTSSTSAAEPLPPVQSTSSTSAGEAAPPVQSTSSTSPPVGPAGEAPDDSS